MGEVRGDKKVIPACPIVKRYYLHNRRLGCINTPDGGTGTTIWKCHKQA